MNLNFAQSLAWVLQSEGGFVNDPNDPGGATNKGVTQNVYDAYRSAHGLMRQSVLYITTAEVSNIYKAQYWDAVRGDSVPAGVDYCLFDEGVNSGPVKSIIDLQTALGVKADGQFGMITMQALNGVNDIEGLIQKICDLRLNWLHRLSTWRFFGAGWSARIKRVCAQSLVMVTAA
jgi:lysozyme family protein